MSLSINKAHGIKLATDRVVFSLSPQIEAKTVDDINASDQTFNQRRTVERA